MNIHLLFGKSTKMRSWRTSCSTQGRRTTCFWFCWYYLGYFLLGM